MFCCDVTSECIFRRLVIACKVFESATSVASYAVTNTNSTTAGIQWSRCLTTNQRFDFPFHLTSRQLRRLTTLVFVTECISLWGQWDDLGTTLVFDTECISLWGQWDDLGTRQLQSVDKY